MNADENRQEQLAIVDRMLAEGSEHIDTGDAVRLAELVRALAEQSPAVAEFGDMNGLAIRRINSTIHIPLPRAAWREVEGGCCCVYCSADGKTAPAFWDTLALAFTKEAKPGGPDTTWMVHAPEYRAGARRKREK